MFKPNPNPPGCVDAEEHERKHTENAEMLEEHGRRMLASSGRIDVATGNQLMVSAIKARAAAAQLALARSNRDYSSWLVAEYERLGGGRKKAGR